MKEDEKESCVESKDWESETAERHENWSKDIFPKKILLNIQDIMHIYFFI